MHFWNLQLHSHRTKIDVGKRNGMHKIMLYDISSFDVLNSWLPLESTHLHVQRLINKSHAACIHWTQLNFSTATPSRSSVARSGTSAISDEISLYCLSTHCTFAEKFAKASPQRPLTSWFTDYVYHRWLPRLQTFMPTTKNWVNFCCLPPCISDRREIRLLRAPPLRASLIHPSLYLIVLTMRTW